LTQEFAGEKTSPGKPHARTNKSATLEGGGGGGGGGTEKNGGG